MTKVRVREKSVEVMTYLRGRETRPVLRRVDVLMT